MIIHILYLQTTRLASFKLKHFELNKYLLDLTKREDFQAAVTIHPILQQDDFYILNAYFLKVQGI